jgi:DNA uptake protein ComE-like DNA-binding protein
MSTEHHRIDINTASVDELAELRLVGRQRAEEIVKGRPFHSWDDLKQLSSISEGMVEDMQKSGATLGSDNGTGRR